ncbi:hypothetical protein ACP70R_007903 [Stipagrostis hirtigluma subsp. patula]
MPTPKPSSAAVLKEQCSHFYGLCGARPATAAGKSTRSSNRL